MSQKEQYDKPRKAKAPEAARQDEELERESQGWTAFWKSLGKKRRRKHGRNL